MKAIEAGEVQVVDPRAAREAQLAAEKASKTGQGAQEGRGGDVTREARPARLYAARGCSLQVQEKTRE